MEELFCMLPLIFVVLVALSVIAVRLARRALLLRRQRHSVLPLSYHRLSRPSSVRWGWSFERTSASIWTTACNDLPRSLVERLGPVVQNGLRGFYNVGVGAALVGIALSVGGLALATMDIWLGLAALDSTTDSQGRDIPASSGARPLLEPIIPGVTRPLSHLPIVVLALLVNQGIHEVGHAISSAVDGIAPAHVSLGMMAYVMPMASVTFHENDLDGLDRSASMRLAAAGPLHNFATWVIMSLALSTSLGSLYVEDVESRGLYVQAIRRGSELANHLPNFAVLTQVDSISLAEPDALDNWARFLTGSGAMTRLSWNDLDDPEKHDTILWQGAHSSLRDDLVLSTSAPRKPRWLCNWVQLYWEYFVGMSLSLALFNLLPFPGSDGSQLVSALLSIEHEDLESGRSRKLLGHRVRHVKLLEWCTMAFGACFGVGQVVHGLVS